MSINWRQNSSKSSFENNSKKPEKKPRTLPLQLEELELELELTRIKLSGQKGFGLGFCADAESTPIPRSRGNEVSKSKPKSEFECEVHIAPSPSHPKPKLVAKTVFSLFCDDEWAKIYEQHPAFTPCDAYSELAKLWENVDPQVKESYRLKAMDYRKRHEKVLKEEIHRMMMWGS